MRVTEETGCEKKVLEKPCRKEGTLKSTGVRATEAVSVQKVDIPKCRCERVTEGNKCARHWNNTQERDRLSKSETPRNRTL